ncbi:MarR family winged helix-turn-helix transcriptional regulator [Pyxidicoccus sp. 3LG]
MRRPDDKPALRVQPLVGEGEEEHDLSEELGEDASTPESRRLHALMIEIGRHRSLKNPLAGICEELQLTPTQMHVLAWLGQDGPVQVGILAHRVGITRKTITGVVDRLETMGMVERTRDAEDRRAVVVRLTARGEDNYKRIHRGVDAGMRRVLDLMGPDDQESFFGIVERMLKRLGAEAQGGSHTA